MAGEVGGRRNMEVQMCYHSPTLQPHNAGLDMSRFFEEGLGGGGGFRIFAEFGKKESHQKILPFGVGRIRARS